MNNVKYSLPFAAHQLFGLLSRENIKTCAVVTTLKNTDKAERLCRLLCEESDAKAINAHFVNKEEPLTDGISLVFLGHLLDDVTTIDRCVACDCAIFIEQYGVTAHKSFDEILDVLRVKNVRVLGVLPLIK